MFLRLENKKSLLSDILIISPLILLYAFHVLQYLWVWPSPSDPLQYLGNVAWGNTNAFFPWLDRIMLANNLAIFGFLPIPIYVSGPLYVLTVNLATMALGIWWARERIGFWAALFFAVFYNVGYFTLYRGVQIFPDTTLTFFSFLAFLSFFHNGSLPFSRRTSVFLTGIFTAFACFSKVTALCMVLFFLIRILVKEKRQFKFWILGLAVGTATACGLFILLYDFASFTNTVSQFFGSNIGLNFKGRPQYDNMVSFFDVIVDPMFAPVFISLLICVGAYRNSEARHAFTFSLLYFGMTSVIYLVTKRGYRPIPTYLYESYLFAALGLSLYLGGRAGALLSLAESSTVRKMGWVFAFMVLVVIGFAVGKKHDPTGIFEVGTLLTDRTASRFYLIGALLVPFGLVALEAYRKVSGRALLVYMLFCALWSSSYGGGLAASNIRKIQAPEAAFFYKNAPVFNEVPAKKFDLFVKRWASQAIHKLPWVYRLFFDEKYERGTGPLRQYNHQREVLASIGIYRDLEKLIGGKGDQILTDVPSVVRAACPGFPIVKEFEWEGTTLYVLERGEGC